MENKFLELRNIKKIYPNGFQAIFNLDLSVNKGEFIVFVGPSGCGKSTSIRMIAGLEEVSGGEIILAGRNATDLPARKRDLSMVFQNYALFPHLTVKENIAFTLKTKHVPREVVEDKVKWAAKILKLDYLLNRKPAQLSGGQRQRVALGRAMVAEPKLFLMDEPLSNLDAKLRGVMRNVIRSLHDDLDTTTIYVTHDQVEAMTMADRIVVMSDGFIQQVGDPVEIFEEPANKFVAKFIGTPEINIIDGTYSSSSFKTALGTVKIKKKLLRKSVSGKYQLGFRPQYCQIVKTSAGAIKDTVKMLEVLGAETIVHTTNGLIVVVPTTEMPKPGKEIFIKPDPKKVVVFDKVKEISLTSIITDETQNSLNTFYDSAKLIEKRTAIMEKQKNKVQNEGLVSRGISLADRMIFPEFILLNPEYAKNKREIRQTKLMLKDARRLRKVSEINQKFSELKDLRISLKEIVKELRSHQKEVFKFESVSKKVRKITGAIETKGKIKDTKVISKLKQLDSLRLEIKESYDNDRVYDYAKINKFVMEFENLKGKNNKGE